MRLMPDSNLGALPQTFERRAFVRYPRRIDALWQFLGMSIQELTSGQIADLSTNGVGLILDRPFAVNTTLMIRIPTILQGWSSHLVRVKRCAELAPGRFEIGCTFVRTLTAEQLQGILRP